jgi:hypothetical protein
VGDKMTDPDEAVREEIRGRLRKANLESSERRDRRKDRKPALTEAEEAALGVQLATYPNTH